MTSFQHLNATAAQEMLAEPHHIADIRDPASFQAGRMVGAQRLDNSNVAQFIAATPKDQPLIVCCYHGNSSQSAAQFFAEQGFETVYSLDGGYELWKAQYPALCEHGD